MAIKTTINIHKGIISKLNHASNILHIPRMRIIRILLKQYSEQNIKVVMFSTVKYQKREDPANWGTFHLYLREVEYEYSNDFRKIYKKSLSLIISEAVKKYLNLLIMKMNKSIVKNIDLYYLKNYIFSRRKKDGIIYTTCFWGLPESGTLLCYIT
jgi:hypothetical protein